MSTAAVAIRESAPAKDAPVTGLDLLRAPFPANQISKLPKPTSKNGTKGTCKECGGYHMLPAVHLDYVGHAALTDRLLDADLLWSWAPLAFTEDGLPRFDASGGLWIKLTVCGVTRLGYGHAEGKGYADIGAREKEVIGDALRNAAMRFGAALDLWHKGELHKSDNGATAEPSEQTTEEPEGFEAWLADLAAVADEGLAKLQDMWSESNVQFRRYLTTTDKAQWEALKAKAAGVGA